MGPQLPLYQTSLKTTLTTAWDLIHKPWCKMNSKGGRGKKKQTKKTKPATRALVIWAPSLPHIYSRLQKRQRSSPGGTGPVLQEHRSFNRPVLLKRGEKMVMTMIILPLMYSHPSIKDTLPQRSVIASQSQLCLDNPSSKCPKCLTVPRTTRDCLQRAV